MALCTFILAGCAVGPNYHPSEAKVPSAWTSPAAAAATRPAIRLTVAAPMGEELARWWTAFRDPTLTSLVERAVKSNLDLQLAEARIRQARGSRGIAVSGLWPDLSATGAYTRSLAPGRPGGPRPKPVDLFQTGLDAVWEVDIFGGARRNIEAANADVQAAIEDRRDVLVTLAAEVALNYIDLRGFQEQIAIAQKNLKAQQHSAELTRQRFQGGFVGALDVANADALVATTASQIPPLDASARQTIYNLSVLLGQEPAALLQELAQSSAIPPVPPEVPAGLPSDLLRRRPDIRRAEAQIHGATARIGVATADLFPKFTLTGTVGYQGAKMESFMDWNKRTWSFGPSATWEIFAAGRIVSNIELQKALTQQSVLTYRKTVLTALQDVENALIATAREQEHRKALEDAVAANRKAVGLATQLYTQGQTDFLNVLDAQRSLYSSEDALVQSTRSASTDLVALYKALGGGWDVPPETPPRPQPGARP